MTTHNAQIHPFLRSHDLQNIPTLMRRLEQRLQSPEYAQISLPFHRHPMSQPLLPPSQTIYPRPLMETPVYPPHQFRPWVGPDFNAYLPSTLIVNVRSLVPKVDELEQTIKMNDVDMICLTETWLHPSILDSVLFLSNYVLFRRDRLSSIGGGVCIYVNAKLHCRRLSDFESPSIESLWLSIRPRYLPRSISVILLAVIYHSTSAGALENSELYDHIQSSVNSYLSHHPDALVMVTGDFNPVSTGFDEKLSGLRQIVNVPTRNDAILDWCLVNLKEPTFLLKQLPPFGSSDHNALLVGRMSNVPQSQKTRQFSKGTYEIVI